MISMTAVPPVTFGAGALGTVADSLRAVTPSGKVAVLLDAFWSDRHEQHMLVEDLLRAEFSPVCHVLPAGEPVSGTIANAANQTRDAVAVVAMGGGSALDTAKMVAACAVGSPDPEAYALGAVPIPRNPLPIIAVPTTAGTGSEANGTAVFSNADKVKLWAYGPGLLPVHVCLDPDLTAGLPPKLTTWCALDAFVHAFEAATNGNAHPLAQRYAAWAIAEIPEALPAALAGDPEARARLLLASFHAGYAIGQCGTSIAHGLSHALARFGPIHHGFATAIAFRASLPWVLRQPREALLPATVALGLKEPEQIPRFVEDLFARCGMESILPEAFSRVSIDALVEEMQQPAGAPMLNATRPVPEAADLISLASAYLAHCPAHAQEAV